MRSRTGCLTCRQRKLKCDEQKPVCSQCRKASRECRPSDGIVFRNQQNPSMNGASEGSGKDGNLGSFYSYKNTFDKDHVWLKIPAKVKFVDVTDPYAEDLDPALTSSPPTSSHGPRADWGPDAAYRSSTSEVAAHGLEALSAAASRDQYSFMPPTSASDHAIMPHPPHYTPYFPQERARSPTSRHSMLPPETPSTSYNPTNNNINFLLNPSSSLSPVIDPSLQSSTEPSSTKSPRTSQESRQESKAEQTAEPDHEVAFLLRHFAEAPGQWMDLFDLHTYFTSSAPIKALNHPLLKYAACALAAKHLGCVHGARRTASELSSVHARIDTWPAAKSRTDWYYYGAEYYEKAIKLLMETIRQEGGLPQHETRKQNTQIASDLSSNGDFHTTMRINLPTSRSDEILAASICILSVYESTGGGAASGEAWDRNLSGARSLLDIAWVNLMPMDQQEHGTEWPPKLSSARRSIFWNLARMDYGLAFNSETETRMTPEDLHYWRSAGLFVDDAGFVEPSNTDTESEDAMREDMISNALVWLLAKIVNYISAGDGPMVGDYMKPPELRSPFGVSQEKLLARWHQLVSELSRWHQGLPATFKPCTRVGPFETMSGDPATTHLPLTEVWYNIPMCASAMQNYHMARILLLVNKPHESTAIRSTVTDRLKSYRSITEEVRFHSQEIIGISLSHPPGSVRVHSVQPLFVAGQTLTDDRQRRVVLDLLTDIEKDLGWVTDYRVKQLSKEWEWAES